MEVHRMVVTIWVTLISVASVVLTRHIVNYIRNKPVISVTLVDLVYCDVLCWLSLGILVSIL
jgi:hypothetical protein